MIGAGQTAQGGGDAYVAKLDSKGKLVYEKQFGTSGKRPGLRPPRPPPMAASMSPASRTATRSSPNMPMAMRPRAPVWQTDLGDLQNGGGIGGLTVSGNQLYVSGTTRTRT